MRSSLNLPVDVCQSTVLAEFELPQVGDDTWYSKIQEHRMPRRRPPKAGRPEQEAELMWRPLLERPPELQELDKAFREAISGITPPGGPPPWGTRCLELAALARFQHAGVVIRFGGRDEVLPIRVEHVQAILFPQGTGIVLIRWSCPRGEPASRVLRRLDALRHLYSEPNTPGLVFFDREGGRSLTAPTPAAQAGTQKPAERTRREAAERRFTHWIGKTLAPAMTLTAEPGQPLQPIALGAFFNWLLLLDGENHDDIDPTRFRDASREAAAKDSTWDPPPECRIGLTRYSHHHTAVVLQRPPSESDRERELHDLLFLLRRAAKPSYSPPPTLPAGDEVHWVRGNRCIAISREGSVALSWRIGHSFEHEAWPGRFQATYRWLLLHVLAERNTLATAAAKLSKVKLPPPGTDAEATRTARDETDALVREVLTKVLAMTWRDCGGLSDYRTFFTAARRAWAVEDLLAEVRAELNELSVFVEREHAAAVERLNTTMERRALQDQTRDAGLQRLVAILTVLLVPLSLFEALASVWPERKAMALGAAVALIVLLGFGMASWSKTPQRDS